MVTFESHNLEFPFESAGRYLQKIIEMRLILSACLPLIAFHNLFICQCRIDGRLHLTCNQDGLYHAAVRIRPLAQVCRSNSIGRASDFQSESCEFEPRLLLKKFISPQNEAACIGDGKVLRSPCIRKWR